MKHIKQYIVAALLMVGLVAPLAVAQPALAAPCSNPKDCATKGSQKATSGDKNARVDNSIKDIVNVLLYVIGIVAVIMIVIGGLRYVLSGGDASSVSAAKNTILYAVIGLVVAILAYAIVNFVVGAF